MKTKQSPIGIKFSLNDSKQKQSNAMLLYIGFLTALFTSGLILCLTTLTNSDVFTPLLIAVMLAVSSAFVVATILLKKGALSAVLPTLVVILLCVVIAPRKTVNGFFIICNGLMDSIGALKGCIMTKVACDYTSGTFSSWCIICSLLAVAIFISLINGRKILCIILALTATISSTLLNKVSTKSIIIAFISLVSIILLNHKINFESIPVFLRRIVTTVLLSGVVFTCATLLPKVPFVCAKGKISSAIDRMRYSGNCVLPDGEFNSLKGFNPSDKTALEVVMSKPQSYYLRGYVGGKYNGHGWSNMESSELYKSSDLFYWLHNSNFSGHTQLSYLDTLLDGEEQNNINVKVISASKKYIYAPYELFNIEGDLYNSSLIGDSALLARGNHGKQSYKYSCCPNLVSKYTTMAAALYDGEKGESKDIKEYLSKESHYNNFIYNTYLDIPESAKNLLATELGERKITDGHLDYGEAKQLILSYLTSGFTYDSDSKSQDSDFLSNFLLQTQSGYSVHFATAATLMFRYYGIPARYVEGYIVTPKDIADAEPNSAINIPEKNAHAWVEFYQDGVGFIPFEVTPGYLDVMEKADDLVGDSSFNKGDKEDNYEDNKDDYLSQQGQDEMNEQYTENHLPIIIFICIGALTVVSALAIALFWLIRKKIKRKRLFLSFASDDYSLAVCNMFAYCATLLVKMKLVSSLSQIYSSYEVLDEIYGHEYSESYKDALSSYEKAKFSNSDLSIEEKNKAKNFLEHTVVLYKNKHKRVKGIVRK